MSDQTGESDSNKLYAAYCFLRTGITNKLFQLYLRSKNLAFEHQRESYLIFKLNLEQLVNDEVGVLCLFLQVYKRLQDACSKFLPRHDRIISLRTKLSSKVVEVDGAKDYK